LATSRSVSCRPIGDYISLQFGLAMLPAVLIQPDADRLAGYREVSPVAILWSTAALMPRFYFLRKSLTPEWGTPS
jgi:hypothetical protein